MLHLQNHTGLQDFAVQESVSYRKKCVNFSFELLREHTACTLQLIPQRCTTVTKTSFTIVSSRFWHIQSVFGDSQIVSGAAGFKQIMQIMRS